MKLPSALRVASAAVLLVPLVGLAQSTASPGASSAAAPSEVPSTRAARQRAARDTFRPRARHLIYVTLPGSLERPAWLNGTGIVVLDANDGYRFVKRLQTWDYAASMSPEQVSGVAASPVTNLIYVAARGRLGAIDMGTDQMVWSVTWTASAASALR